MRKLYKPSKGNSQVSGGIRINTNKSETQTVEILGPGILIWGIHNSIAWHDVVLPGFLEYISEGVGEWYGFVPLFESDLYYKVLPPEDARVSMTGDQRTTYNQKNGFWICRFRDAEVYTMFSRSLNL